MGWLSIAFVSGILNAFLLHYTLYALITSVFFFLFLLKSKTDNAFILFLLLTIWNIGWAYHSFTLDIMDKKSGLASHFNDYDVSFKGVLLSKGETRTGQRLLLENSLLSSETMYTTWDIQYFVYSSNSTIGSIGDTIEGKGIFLAFFGKRNPGDFDFRLFNYRKGIFGKIYQDDETELFITEPEGWSHLSSLADVRNSVRSIFSRKTDSDVAGLLSALILGDKSSVDPELKDAFIETGVIHVLAVSGLHVGYVLIILLFFSKIFRIPWGWDRLGIILGLGGFILLTGGKASVIRASIMAGLYVLAPVLNRPNNAWNIISSAGFLILLWNPVLIADTGFLLSFVAVISIVFLLGIFENILPEKLKVSHVHNGAVRFIWGLFLVSVSAQIGTLPFTAWYFGRIPLISLIANVIIVPLIGILVALGFTILLLGWIPFFSSGWAESAWIVTKGIQWCSGFFSSVPFASIPIQGLYLVHLVQYGLVITFLFMVFQKQYRGKAILAGVLFITINVWTWSLEKKGLDILFLDVGQGDSAIIQFENGKTMLVDAGQRNWNRDYGEQVVIPSARYLGVKRFNWVVMTHPHSDHIGGLVSVLEAVPVDTVWDTFSEYGSWTYNQLLESFKQKGVVYRQPNRGETIFIDEKTSLQILAPDSTMVKNEHNVNNMSIVFRLIHGKVTVLFTGDLEKEGDHLLLSLQSYLDSDVLKVAHHGSITSTTQPLLDMITPELAVISVGRKNKFKHPSPIVIQRLLDANVRIHRTDRDGAIWLNSDGKSIKAFAWR